jgi:hypothetical protein
MLAFTPTGWEAFIGDVLDGRPLSDHLSFS